MHGLETQSYLLIVVVLRYLGIKAYVDCRAVELNGRVMIMFVCLYVGCRLHTELLQLVPAEGAVPVSRASIVTAVFGGTLQSEVHSLSYNRIRRPRLSHSERSKL